MMPLQETRWLEMVYISVNDFLEKVRGIEALSRSEEVECAKRMKEGDIAARERLIQGYLPFWQGISDIFRSTDRVWDWFFIVFRHWKRRWIILIFFRTVNHFRIV